MQFTKKNILLLLRIVTGLGLLAALIFWIGPAKLTETLTTFHPGWYALATFLLFLHYFLQSVVLRVLLTSKHVPVKARNIFRVTVISNFFGLFLPGGTGPDFVLCFNMARGSEKKEVALSAIIFMRMAVLFIMAVTAFLFSFHPIASGVEVRIMTGVVVLAFLVYYIIMANQNSINIARRLLNVLNRHHFTSILYKTYFALSDFGREHTTVIRVAPLLLSSALIKIIIDYYIALALGIEVSAIYFFVFIPIITIVSAIPITFAGLGVREGTFVGLFALVGVSAPEAVAISLVSFTISIIVAIVGALLYLFCGASLGTPQPSNPETARV